MIEKRAKSERKESEKRVRLSEGARQSPLLSFQSLFDHKRLVNPI